MIKEAAALAASEAIAAGRRKAMQFSLYAVAALLGVAAIGFALGGLHAILSIDYGPITASFSIAGGLLLLALIMFVGGKLWRPKRSAGQVLATAALVAAPVAASRLLTPGAAKGAALAGTLALGAVLGRKLSGE